MINFTVVSEDVSANKTLIVAVLGETRRLLQEKGWNRFSMARGADGKAVSPNSSAASCYCLSGALAKAWRTIDPENEDFYFQYFERKFSDALRNVYGYDGAVTRWNDEIATRQEDVVTLIESVIKSIQQ